MCIERQNLFSKEMPEHNYSKTLLRAVDNDDKTKKALQD